MKTLKVISRVLLVILLLVVGIVVVLVFTVKSSNSSQPKQINETLYASSCGVSLVLNVNPNWLEGDAMSFDFNYNGRLLSNYIIPNYPTSSQPETPIETVPVGNGPFEIDVLARTTSRDDFENVAHCIASNVTQFNEALATLGTHLSAKDRNFYTPYAIKSIVYVP